MANTHNYYPHLSFPDYTFNEYPRMVDHKFHIDPVTGRKTETYKLVNSPEEERAVLAGGKSDAELEGEREELISQAKVRGVLIDKRWTTDRIRAALAG